MEIIGRELEVGFGVEETRGTPQGTAEKWLKNVTANIIERSEKAIDDNSHAVLEDSDQSRVVKKWIEGDIEGIVHVDPIGYLFLNIYGADVDSDLGSGAYQHIFNVAQNIQHPSLSIFAKDGSVQQLVFDNGMVNTLELTAAVDDFVRFTANFMGKATTDNSDTPAYTNEYDFVGCDITVKIADTEAGLPAADAKKVKELSINWDQGLIPDHILGSCTPDDIYNAKMSIEGELTLNFDDEVFKDLFLADTAKYMEISIVGTADIGGGENPTITILLYKVQIQDWTRAGANDELVTQVVSFKAFYNETDDKQSQVTLKNNTAEYDQPISA